MNYPGEFGYRRQPTDEFGQGGGRVALPNLNQDFLGLSLEVKKLKKKYRPFKKSMMRESDAYCNGKVY